MTELPPGEDFVENLRRREAREAAKQRAIDPPKRRSAPRRATKTGSGSSYAQQALWDEVANVASASEGVRNDTLNTAAIKLGSLVGAGALELATVRAELARAARQCGLPDDEIRKCLRLKDGALSKGMSTPRDMSNVGRVSAEQPSTKSKGSKESDDEDDTRAIRWVRASTIKTRVPQWVWHYEGVGRIQLGTLTMFAGKPAAGKSTATRWFAAQLSRGTLPGVWEGTPMNVAMVSIEEQEDNTVAPSLEVAGADMSRIMLPRITEAGRESMFSSIRDEQMFTESLLDYDIRAVFVDPVMSTFSGKADVYRNNEVRDYLQPFVRIAKAINGIVVCVHHLRKGTVSDVLGSMNGSSAFGEVPRAVFGFAPFQNDSSVMEQVKNSAGVSGLKLEYHLPVEYTEDEDGIPFELPVFEIKGTTTVSISDIDENKDQLTAIAFTMQWLEDYLMENQPMPVWQIQKDAKAAGVVNNDKMLSRARQRLGVVSRSQPVKDKPNQHVWMLPEFAKGYGRFGNGT